MSWKNYHAHTYRCKHAKGDAVQFARAARVGGASVYGMSDHAALPDDRWDNVRMAHKELDDYVAAVRHAQAEVPEITVLLGMECEDVPEFRSYYEEELLGRRCFDYLIGAGHYTPLDGEWLNSFSELTNSRALRAYSDHLTEMMATGLYAFIAHPDVYGVCLDRWDREAETCARDILADPESHPGLASTRTRKPRSKSTATDSASVRSSRQKASANPTRGNRFGNWRRSIR